MYTNLTWLPVKGYELLYEISNTGLIRSKTRKVWNGRVFYTKPGRLLSLQDNGNGYLKVILYDKGYVNRYVHRLVAEHYIIHDPLCTEVNHIDGNKTNNRVYNLEWVTAQENNHHARRVGLISKRLDIFTESFIRLICVPGDRLLGYNALAKVFNVSRAHIKNIYTEKYRDWMETH